MASGVLNNVAANSFGESDKNLLRTRADAAQMNCHVSSVIYKIRDHGPAVLDGEFYKDSSNAALPGKAPAAAPASAPSASAPEVAASAPVASQLLNRGVIRVMMFSILLLAVALVSVGFYAYQQKLHVNDLQAELKIYDDLNKDI